MSIVFDTFALMAWLQEEPSAPQVEDWLVKAEQKDIDVFVSIVNLGEVYYRMQKLGQDEAAEEFLQDIRMRAIPLKAAPATNRRVWAAARLKAKYPIAYADGFAAALAQELHAPLLTGDPDFELLAKEGVVQVVWLPFPRT
ncbi:MAG: type II toxin-antitoxin system VapC family toxin [Chloroflexi bacterium]|nr:type II toxin-antitoxin system VapC family toxin [Chloroflexota bacterium]